jgi:DNA-binding NtrC family response regulator
MSVPGTILIVDEDGFSKVCSAILRDEGYQTRLAFSYDEALEHLSGNSISLIVSSYPYAVSVLRSGLLNNIPTLVLSDELNDDILQTIKGLKNAVCLLKPLDFDRFKYIVRGMVNGYIDYTGGHVIA